MRKVDLINALQASNGYEFSKKESGEIIDCIFANIKKAIKEEKRFAYPHFVTFTVKKRKAWTGRNPQTGEIIKIKASKTVGFKPALSLKSALWKFSSNREKSRINRSFKSIS